MRWSGSRYGGRRGRKGPEVVVAPLLDMMFLLLIFFLVTTTFSREAGLEIRKPRVSEADELGPRSIRIALGPLETIYVEGRPALLSEVGPLVREARAVRPGVPVVLLADREALTGSVVAVMDEARRAGVGEIALAVEEER